MGLSRLPLTTPTSAPPGPRATQSQSEDVGASSWEPPEMVAAPGCPQSQHLQSQTAQLALPSGPGTDRGRAAALVVAHAPFRLPCPRSPPSLSPNTMSGLLLRAQFTPHGFPLSQMSTLAQGYLPGGQPWLCGRALGARHRPQGPFHPALAVGGVPGKGTSGRLFLSFPTRMLSSSIPEIVLGGSESETPKRESAGSEAAHLLAFLLRGRHQLPKSKRHG